MALAARYPLLEVLAVTVPQRPIDYCPLCPVRIAPDPRFHPGGQAVHRELFGMPVSVLTDTDKRTLLLGLETLARLRKANRMDPAGVEALRARLRSEWFGEAS